MRASAGDAAASSCLTHRKDDSARRGHGTRQPSTLLRGGKSAFGVRGRRVETRPSQPSCDTNSAATRCSGGGGVVSVLQRDWLRWEEARSRLRGHGKVASPQSMRGKRQVRWRQFLFLNVKIDKADL